MHDFQDSLAAWSSIIGTLLSIVGVFQARAWTAVTGLILVAASLGAFAYARRERAHVQHSNISISGRRIDALNIANLTRLQNKTLVVQSARHTARIQGQDLHIIWRYSGYCRAIQESSIVFSVDAENNVPFNDLECFAYDLQHDPGRTHKIRPILLGPDGISKKLEVAMLSPIAVSQPFSIELDCVLPGCMKSGVQYYAASLSFDQPSVDRFEVRLQFEGAQPDFVRAYTQEPGSSLRLLKDLKPQCTAVNICEYVDRSNSISAQSARIYLFNRQLT